MARRKPAPRFAAVTRDGGPPLTVRTADNIVNAEARLGLGADNLASTAAYSYSVVSRNRQNLDNAYRSSWLVGVAVDCVADDMTRAGIELTGEIEPADIEAITAEFADLHLWGQLANTVRWARLYGGCIAALLVDGQNPATPLRVETIREGQFRGLLVLDRWMVTPSLDNIVTEFGPDMGQPTFYTVNSSQGAAGIGGGGRANSFNATSSTGVNIHYTRVIRLDGNELPFFARQTEQGWGQSIVERLYDRLLAYDSATQGAAQLVYKAHLRTLSVEGLRDALAFGGKSLEGIVRSVDFIRKFQSNDGLTLLDSRDTFAAHSYSFDGLPQLLGQFSEQLSGALQIPLVRLFGQSPAGFSSGDTDLQNYYDMISAQQTSKLRRPMMKLLDVVCRSRCGRELPEDFGFKFTSLWQLSAAERADVAGKVTNAVVAAKDAGLVSPKVGMEELRQSSHVTGVFSNISDEDIEAADADPPVPGEMALPDAMGAGPLPSLQPLTPASAPPPEPPTPSNDAAPLYGPPEAPTNDAGQAIAEDTPDEPDAAPRPADRR